MRRQKRTRAGEMSTPSPLELPRGYASPLIFIEPQYFIWTPLEILPSGRGGYGGHSPSSRKQAFSLDSATMIRILGTCSMHLSGNFHSKEEFKALEDQKSAAEMRASNFKKDLSEFKKKQLNVISKLSRELEGEEEELKVQAEEKKQIVDQLAAMTVLEEDEYETTRSLSSRAKFVKCVHEVKGDFLVVVDMGFNNALDLVKARNPEVDLITYGISPYHKLIDRVIIFPPRSEVDDTEDEDD